MVEKSSITTILIVMLAAAFLGAAGCRTVPSASAPDDAVAAGIGETEADEDLKNLMMLSEALKLAQRSHVDEHSYRDLVYSAADLMLHSLDPHSAFVPPEPLESLVEETSGKFGGIGLSVESVGNGVRVMAPVADSPAAKAGIKAGDTIVAVDGQSLQGVSLNDAVKSMRGEAGTEVKVTVRRPSGEEVQVPIKRDEIKVTSVKGAEQLGDDLGYVRIVQFSKSVPSDFAKALAQFRRKKVKGLIVDLRNNPGGLLESAVGVAEQVLPQGSEIVSVRGRQSDGKPNKFTAGWCQGRDTGLPLAVLVNGASASASEVLAGALKDHHRAVLVGETTYGKASVQSVIPLKTNPDCAVRLTTAYYFTPSGHQIHGRGIEPDEKVAVDEAERQRIYRQQVARERGGGVNLSQIGDRQLERACEILRGGAQPEQGKE